MTTARVNLLGLPMAKLQAFFVEMGEKPFRAQQVLKWMHHAGVDSFAEMTNLGKALREKLEQVAEIRPPEVVSQQDSEDERPAQRPCARSGFALSVRYPPRRRGPFPYGRSWRESCRRD